MAVKNLPNLLIVDDNELNLFYLEALIKPVNVNLIKATSGSEALIITKGVELALAILDVRMPQMDGYELATKINQDRVDDKVPVIFLTANFIDETELFIGYNSGAVDYIFKPVSSHILLCKINVFLELYNQKLKIIRGAEKLKESSDKLVRTNNMLKKREEKLVQEQLFNKALLNSIPGIFYLYSLPDLRMIMWNKQHETMFGYEPDEMKGRHVLTWHLPERAEAVMDSLENELDSGQVSVETPLVKKDGSTIPFMLTGVKFKSNGHRYLIGIGSDVSNRKRTEEELRNSLEQLQQLTNHIEKIRENERLTIARDLHDDLGQALTAVKIDLGIIKQKVSDSELVSKINNVTALVGETIKSVQRITSQLRPEIIDDLGLNAAIQWYAREFSERNSIEILLDLDASIEIASDNALTLFRIMQESLTNIARHSKATQAEISLYKCKQGILFRLSDNGIGISDPDLNSKKSFGIIGMKERATSMGGSCEIYSNKKNRGTIIELTLPLNIN
ncbi:MAG: response regulator [Lentimicrobium sp.]|nr:response regulator [Lentimicrobium sp.]